MSLPGSADVVIAGAGIAGLAVAHALRPRGIEALVLDASPAPPSRATARAAWIVRTDSDDDALAALMERSLELWATGRYGVFRACGGFLVHASGADELARHVPGAAGRGTWRPQDGLAEPSSVLGALRPGRCAFGVEVLRAEAAGGGCDVVTSRGVVRARALVGALGAWSGTLGLALAPLKRHVVLTSSRALAPGAPFAWHLAEGLYFRPHPEGTLLSACEEAPSSPGDEACEAGTAAEAVAKMKRLQPGLGPQRVIAAWAGQRTFAPGRRPVVGWDPGSPHLFHVAGLGGQGITLAPALGEAVAEAIARGRDAPPPPRIARLAPGPS